MLSAHDDALEPQFTVTEIEMAVPERLEDAIAAGVRSVEHGLYLTDEHAEAVARAGCYLVPTLAILEDVLAWARAGLLPPYATEKAALLAVRVGAAVAVARVHGCRSRSAPTSCGATSTAPSCANLVPHVRRFLRFSRRVA